MKKTESASDGKQMHCLLTTAVLAAVLLLMSFTPLGYLHIGAISMSLLTIPAAVGAMTCGIRSAVFLGGLFGVTSLAQCFGMDSLKTFMYGISPFWMVMLCLLPRLLTGFCTGLAAKHTKKYGLCSYAICGFCCAVCNSVFFFTALVLGFWQNPAFMAKLPELNMQSDSLFSFFTSSIGFNCMFEAVVCFAVTFLIGWLLNRAGMISAVNPFDHHYPKGLLNR